MRGVRRESRRRTRSWTGRTAPSAPSLRRIRINLAAALVASALIAGPARGAGPDSRTASLERDFVANGRISMDLSAGEYRLTGSSENKIKMAWDVRDAWRLSEVK